MKRRHLLLGAAAAGGALIVGWSILPVRSRLGSGELLPLSNGEVALNGWIRIEPDGGVALAMNRSEMGQGVHTALSMLVAEELSLPLGRVSLVQAGPEKLYGNVAALVGNLPVHPRDAQPGRETATVRLGRWMVSKLARELGINLTGGSTTVVDAWMPLRLAAATARAQLVGAASLRWRLPATEIEVVDGVVRHPSGPKAHFGELAAAAAGTSVSNVALKPRGDWTLIGRAAPRVDVAAKSNGSAVFGIDVRPDGLLFAAVRMCPMLGGAPGAIANEDEVLRRPGVLRLVRLPPADGSTAGIAVVAHSTWHARSAVEALQVQWQAPPNGTVDSAQILRALEASAREAHEHGGGFAFHERGDARAALRDARVIEATYRAPYLAHATLEPMNCTARVKDGRVEVWAPTQVPGMARAAAARALGLRESDVTVHVTLLGGGFGRRLEVDYVAQAATVAAQTGGRPVQIVWSREEDFTHDFYRPAGVAVLRAALGSDGTPRAWTCTSAGDAISPRWLERGLPALAGPVDAPDKTTAEGLFDLPYDIPAQRIAHVATRHAVPVGFWRSVGHSHNAFFSECFMDELAHAAGADPVAYRLSLLHDAPRYAAVLKLAAQKSGWNSPPPAGRARGVALHESFGSVVAQVLECSIDAGVPRVHRVVVAIDCGTVVNPGIVAQQMESGVIFGLGAALGAGIDIVGSEVQQKNFPDYPLLRLANTPVIETHIVPSTLEPTGVGEPATPPAAPALANALFALTGRRLRELPLRLA